MASSLSDAQIEQMLVEAEARLTTKGGAGRGEKAPSPAARDGPPAAAGGKVPARKADDSLAVRTPRLAAKKIKASQQDDAGADWFHMPRTKLTPELKQDLRVLRMRDVLDTKQFWRKDTRKDFIPKFCHVGTVVDGPLDAHSSDRLTRRARKRTIVEEVLASAEATAKFKSRFSDIQARKQSGKKGYYKQLVAKRRHRP